jgi:hypothetical protein
VNFASTWESACLFWTQISSLVVILWYGIDIHVK